jgi:hypothetical protein
LRKRGKKEKKRKGFYLIRGKMPSILRTMGVVAAGWAAVSTALPAFPKFTRDQMKIYELSKRQSAAEQALGLTDVDVLQL